jgi:hypothetical protein
MIGDIMEAQIMKGRESATGQEDRGTGATPAAGAKDGATQGTTL